MNDELVTLYCETTERWLSAGAPDDLADVLDLLWDHMTSDERTATKILL